MKFKIILFALFSILTSNAQTPRAGGINNSQATILNAVHDNMVGVQPTNNNALAVYDFTTNFNYQLGLKTTDNLPEGAANKYFSNALARNAFSAGFGLVYSSGVYGLDSATQGILASVSGKFNNPIGTTSQYVRGDGSLGNYSPDQVVTLTAGNRISITGTYPNYTISYIEPIPVVVTRAFNSNFTISSKQAFVSYSVTCNVTNPLLAGSSTADLYLEYSTNAGSTWSLPSRNGNLSSVALAVAIAITNGQTVTVCGFIPANALVRLRSATTGSASLTYITGQETY